MYCKEKTETRSAKLSAEVGTGGGWGTCILRISSYIEESEWQGNRAFGWGKYMNLWKGKITTPKNIQMNRGEAS